MGKFKARDWKKLGPLTTLRRKCDECDELISHMNKKTNELMCSNGHVQSYRRGA